MTIHLPFSQVFVLCSDLATRYVYCFHTKQANSSFSALLFSNEFQVLMSRSFISSKCLSMSLYLQIYIYQDLKNLIFPDLGPSMDEGKIVLVGNESDVLHCGFSYAIKDDGKRYFCSVFRKYMKIQISIYSSLHPFDDLESARCARSHHLGSFVRLV